MYFDHLSGACATESWLKCYFHGVSIFFIFLDEKIAKRHKWWKTVLKLFLVFIVDSQELFYSPSPTPPGEYPQKVNSSSFSLVPYSEEASFVTDLLLWYVQFWDIITEIFDKGNTKYFRDGAFRCELCLYIPVWQKFICILTVWEPLY